jgi:hypothetical protein
MIPSRFRRGLNDTDNFVSLDQLVEMWELQDGKCAISGVTMTRLPFGDDEMTNASIDRIDNTRGYCADNVRLVCTIVNYMRHKLNDTELLSWCKANVAKHEST